MKSKEVSLIIVSSLILLPFFAGEAFAQENQSLTITTEKESYSAGEPIQIVGLVESKVNDFKVTLSAIICFFVLKLIIFYTGIML